MKYHLDLQFIFPLLFLFSIISCSSESSYNNNPNEVSYRHNGVVVHFPKDYKKIDQEYILKVDTTLGIYKEMHLKESKFSTYF